MYKILRLLSKFPILEMAGKKAASVFPWAVAADKIKLLSLVKKVFIAAFWIFVSDGQPFSWI